METVQFNMSCYTERDTEIHEIQKFLQIEI